MQRIYKFIDCKNKGKFCIKGCTVGDSSLFHKAFINATDLKMFDMYGQYSIVLDFKSMSVKKNLRYYYSLVHFEPMKIKLI